jgi:hypothetical protein
MHGWTQLSSAPLHNEHDGSSTNQQLKPRTLLLLTFREQHMIESECCHSAFNEESVHWVSVRRSSAPV